MYIFLLFYSSRVRASDSLNSTVADVEAANMSSKFPHFGTSAVHVGQEPEQWELNQVNTLIVEVMF